MDDTKIRIGVCIFKLDSSGKYHLRRVLRPSRKVRGMGPRCWKWDGMRRAGQSPMCDICVHFIWDKKCKYACSIPGHRIPEPGCKACRFCPHPHPTEPGHPFFVSQTPCRQGYKCEDLACIYVHPLDMPRPHAPPYVQNLKENNSRFIRRYYSREDTIVIFLEPRSSDSTTVPCTTFPNDVFPPTPPSTIATISEPSSPESPLSSEVGMEEVPPVFPSITYSEHWDPDAYPTTTSQEEPGATQHNTVRKPRRGTPIRTSTRLAALRGGARQLLPPLAIPVMVSQASQASLSQSLAPMSAGPGSGPSARTALISHVRRIPTSAGTFPRSHLIPTGPAGTILPALRPPMMHPPSGAPFPPFIGVVGSAKPSPAAFAPSPGSQPPYLGPPPPPVNFVPPPSIVFPRTGILPYGGQPLPNGFHSVISLPGPVMPLI